MLDFPYISRLQQLLVFAVHWMGIAVLKDHTSWQMFMPLPANNLIQSAQHVTAHVHITFWISKYQYNIDDSFSREYRYHGLPAHWRLYILWLSMKMGVSTGLKYILSKIDNVLDQILVSATVSVRKCTRPNICNSEC
jgi:hypothetical protein